MQWEQPVTGWYWDWHVVNLACQVTGLAVNGLYIYIKSCSVLYDALGEANDVLGAKI
jgi:hypothetical protein